MTIRGVILFGLVLALMAGCSNLPDMRRAEKAAEWGDVQQARKQLEKLARFGLPDAQVALGDLYADRDTSEDRRRALHWYQMALKQGSERARIRIGKLYAREGNTPEQRAQGARYLRKNLANGDDSALIPLVNLYLQYPREFSDRDPLALIKRARAKGDPAADYALARYYLLNGGFKAHLADIESLCQPIAEAEPDCFPLLARVYMTQDRPDQLKALVKRAEDDWHAGEIDDRALYLFAEWLSDDEAPQPQVVTSDRLYQLLTPQYVPALTARARLIMDNTYLAEPDKVIKMLQDARASGDLKASLSLARVYERGRIVPQDPAKAIQYANEALAQYASADYLLGRIYKRGYLGEPEPEKALQHLLKAAREGYPKADYLLAELFWEGKGVAVNRRYAWSFSTLALRGGVERARRLRQEMVASTPQALRDDAERLMQREIALRQQRRTKEVVAAQSNETPGGQSR